MKAKPESHSGRTVLVGVGAGIAAYKVAYVVRGLRERGHAVHVIPTLNSLHFVGEQTWQELSENPVGTDVFHGVGQLSHVRLAREADLFLVAPATADLLSQFRAGAASSMLTATFLASGCPKVLVPAMHHNMWTDAATKDNVSVLRERGLTVLEPRVGNLSSGDTGAGRMPEPEEILAAVDAVLAPIELPLAGQHVVVTAGGTVEPLDPVRYLGNRSTGRQGIEIAKAAAAAGARVTLLVAQTSVPLPQDAAIQVVSTPTAELMLDGLERYVPGALALFMAAAVADYRPKSTASGKLKKETWGDEPVIELELNPDLLHTVAHSPWRPQIVVGFAAETGTDEEVNRLGKEKARRKGADMIAINRVGEDTGFGEVENSLLLVDGDGGVLGELVGDKASLAAGLVDMAVTAAG